MKFANLVKTFDVVTIVACIVAAILSYFAPLAIAFLVAIIGFWFLISCKIKRFESRFESMLTNLNQEVIKSLAIISSLEKDLEKFKEQTE